MRRRRSSSASSGMSSWNGRISVPVSTVATRTSRSSVDPSIVEGRRITASAANFVEAIALRRRGERSKDDTLRVRAASQRYSPHLYRRERTPAAEARPKTCSRWLHRRLVVQRGGVPGHPRPPGQLGLRRHNEKVVPEFVIVLA